MAHFDPPRHGEGDHAKHGGGAPSVTPNDNRLETGPVPLHPGACGVAVPLPVPGRI